MGLQMFQRQLNINNSSWGQWPSLSVSLTVSPPTPRCLSFRLSFCLSDKLYCPPSLSPCLQTVGLRCCMLLLKLPFVRQHLQSFAVFTTQSFYALMTARVLVELHVECQYAVCRKNVHGDDIQAIFNGPWSHHFKADESRDHEEQNPNND